MEIIFNFIYLNTIQLKDYLYILSEISYTKKLLTIYINFILYTAFMLIIIKNMQNFKEVFRICYYNNISDNKLQIKFTNVFP